jgi:hypothetical protein
MNGYLYVMNSNIGVLLDGPVVNIISNKRLYITCNSTFQALSGHKAIPKRQLLVS